MSNKSVQPLKYIGQAWRIIFSANLHAYKLAGKDHFNASIGCQVFFREFDYELVADEYKIKKLYHQFFSEDEIKFLADHLLKVLFSQIEEYAKN